MRETEKSGVTFSAIARKHGIVTGLLLRWRVEFGVAQEMRARLASVALAEPSRPHPGSAYFDLPPLRAAA